MSLPPERISIKRRRGDEPVDTLVLERDKKRRFTDFYFQRVQGGVIDLAPKHSPKQQTPPPSGIPIIRSTKPGDEDRELAAYRAAHNERHECKSTSADIEKKSAEISVGDPLLDLNSKHSARRFHLTRDLSSALKPNQSSGIRKPQWSVRPPLPTFIEKHQMNNNGENSTKDRIVHLSKSDNASHEAKSSSAVDRIISRTQVQTFKQPANTKIKLGHSIRDDPSTWDLSSDQLADELASLAMEMDTDLAPQRSSQDETPRQKPPQTPAPQLQSYPGDDFVYETYVRVPIKSAEPNMDFGDVSGDFGFLVIDDDVDDLWQQYMNEDDDDSDWDEEDKDSNAEDNPRNDYPEDEVSSDDEYGRNVYKYRNHKSDDEQDE